MLAVLWWLLPCPSLSILQYVTLPLRQDRYSGSGRFVPDIGSLLFSFGLSSIGAVTYQYSRRRLFAILIRRIGLASRGAVTYQYTRRRLFAIPIRRIGLASRGAATYQYRGGGQLDILIYLPTCILTHLLTYVPIYLSIS